MTRGLRALLAVGLFWICAPPLIAQRTLEIERFDSRIVVATDGTIDVSETIRARFTGSWNGIYRKVPVDYRTDGGFKWSVRLELISATDDAGTPLRIETSREGHLIEYKMWIPGAQDAVKTIVLRYKVRNALRFFEEHDELYWNATGDEWDVALGEVSAVVVLPSGSGGVRATAFNGVYGSTAREAVSEIAGDSVRFTMPRKLEFREGLTVVVGWDKGLVPEPTTGQKVAGFVAANWPLALPIPVLILMSMLWSRRGRDPRGLPVTVQYEPPGGLRPAEAGTLTDESADMRDITATVVDLAVRGHLKIEEKEESKLFGLVKDKEFVFRRTDPPAGGPRLLSYESKVLNGIFSSNPQVVFLSDLKNEFYKQLTGIKSDIMEQLVQHRFYATRPDSVRNRWMGLGIVAGLVVGMGGAALGSNFGLAPVSFIVAGISIGIIMLAFGYHMPARTTAGARALEKVLGFSEFLERVEKENYQVVKTPEMFERFLPYAMAFGVEEKWARAFKDLYMEPPSWYTGGSIHSFNAARFSSSLSSMSERAGSVMSSSPRSSSGSGFSGGSSGGGGGGGGGGGF